jgi:citrate lyase synthetase
MNDEMVMHEGVERSAIPNIERMLHVFDLHFSTSEEKAVSRICASKARRNLQTFGWCLQFKQSCPWATLSYFCTLKTSREINATGLFGT